MNAPSSASNGNFDWKHLKCEDLHYPQQTDFHFHFVYKEGEVLLKSGSNAELFEFGSSIGIKDLSAQDFIRCRQLFTNAGYLVETKTNLEAFHAARNAYHAEYARRHSDFKKALFEREGLTDNPKADLCYSKASEQCHGEGHDQIANRFMDLADLIR